MCNASDAETHRGHPHDDTGGTMELPKIISVDDHVVEPRARLADLAAREVPGEGAAGGAQALGRVPAQEGRQVRDDRGSRGRMGRRLDLRGQGHLRAEEVRRDPEVGDVGRRRVDVRQDGHDDDRDHLRRHAARAAGTRRSARRTSSSTGSTARCRSPRSRGSAARRSKRPTTWSSRSPASRPTTTGWSRSGATPRSASTSRSASSRSGTSSSPPRRSSATRHAACGRCASRSCRPGSTSRASTPATGTRCSRPCADTGTTVCMHVGSSSTDPFSSKDAPAGVGEHGRLQQLDGVARRLPLRRDHAPVPEAEDRVLRRPDRMVAVRARAGRHRVAGAQRLAELQAPVPRAAVDLLLRPRVRLLHLGPARREVARRGRREQHLLRDRLPAHRHDVAELARSTARRCSTGLTDEQKYKILRGNAIRMLELDRV